MAEPRPDPPFLADHLALDFLNSIAAPWGSEIEWVANGSDLIAWLERSGAVPPDAAAHLRSTYLWGPALEPVAAQARDLREWFRGFVTQHAGKPLDATVLGDLALLNDLLGRYDSYWQVGVASDHHSPVAGSHGHGPLSLERLRRWQIPESLLLPLAEAIADLICHKDFGLVRGCEGPTCTLWFHDVSKGHTRRWCSMAVCGNRAKAAAHRARKHRHADPKDTPGT